MKRAIVIIAIFFCLSLTVSADNMLSEISDSLGLGEVNDILPDDIGEDIEYSPGEVPRAMSLDVLFARIKELFFIDLKSCVILFVKILSVLIVSAILSSVSQTLSIGAYDYVCNAVISLSMSIILFSTVKDTLDSISVFLSVLTAFMSSFLPFMAAVMCAMAKVGEAALHSAFLSSVITMMSLICNTSVFPAIKALFAITTAGYISKVNISEVNGEIEKISTRIMMVIFGLLVAIMHFQNKIVSGADSLAMHCTRLLAGTFVPIVGGLLSQASSTVVSSLNMIKSSLGAFGFIAIVYLAIVPVLSLETKKITMSFLSLVSSMIGLDREGKYINATIKILNILTALMIFTSVFFVISVALMVRSE